MAIPRARHALFLMFGCIVGGPACAAILGDDFVIDDEDDDDDDDSTASTTGSTGGCDNDVDDCTFCLNCACGGEVEACAFDANCNTIVQCLNAGCCFDTPCDPFSEPICDFGGVCEDPQGYPGVELLNAVADCSAENCPQACGGGV